MTTTTTRTDVHRPAELTTEDYVYVGGFDNEKGLPGDSPAGARRQALRQAIQASTTTRYASGHQCDHCGAHIRYVGVLRHVPTGDHLAVGETCLDNRFPLATPEFHAMRKAAQLDREAQRLVAASAAYRAEHADIDWTALDASANGFVQDVLRKLRQYGNLSDRQLEAIVGAVAKDAERAARQAAEVANPTPKAEAPEGVATVTGRVVSVKARETDFGIVWKMTVVSTTEDGAEFRTWGTIPAAIDPEVGDVVTFTANFNRADDDASMAFFKRPRKASVAGEEVAA